ncbi:hypothetical protein ABCR94_00155 [Streptomyces sp. 21So2-11]|uniref:hypothetical protein n=1 Tax=Streptomyces sp. 21So2-11 TaxID=3144408 RepID=UPI00321C088C
MAVSVSAVVVLAILTVVFMRSGGLKAGHAVVCTLLGFHLASSSIAPTIREATTGVVRMIGGINF